MTTASDTAPDSGLPAPALEPAPHDPDGSPGPGSLDLPPTALTARVRLLETIEADVRSRLAALDGR
jgi:hypothetical protein